MFGHLRRAIELLLSFMGIMLQSTYSTSRKVEISENHIFVLWRWTWKKPCTQQQLNKYTTPTGST
jgi:hypothetical protein